MIPPIRTGPARCPVCKQVHADLYDGACAVCTIIRIKKEVSDARVELDRYLRAGKLVEAK